MLRDDIARYTELSGEDGEHTSIQRIGAYLDGYDDGYEQGKKDYGRSNDWIPVSERLPEKAKQVMCSDKQGRVFTSAMTHINSNGEPSFGKHYGVIAWMPLPEPYKGGDTE